MKQYKVYEKSQNQYEAVKQGFSWPGFFFSFWWCLFKKLWVIAVILVGSLLCLGILVNIVGLNATASSAVINLASVGISFYFGFKGNELRTDDIYNRGGKLLTTITASNPRSAITLALIRKHSSIV